jgi:hypothetical protein
MPHSLFCAPSTRDPRPVYLSIRLRGYLGLARSRRGGAVGRSTPSAWTTRGWRGRRTGEAGVRERVREREREPLLADRPPIKSFVTSGGGGSGGGERGRARGWGWGWRSCLYYEFSSSVCEFLGPTLCILTRGYVPARPRGDMAFLFHLLARFISLPPLNTFPSSAHRYTQVRKIYITLPLLINRALKDLAPLHC